MARHVALFLSPSLAISRCAPATWPTKPTPTTVPMWMRSLSVCLQISSSEHGSRKTPFMSPLPTLVVCWLDILRCMCVCVCEDSTAFCGLCDGDTYIFWSTARTWGADFCDGCADCALELNTSWMLVKDVEIFNYRTPRIAASCNARRFVCLLSLVWLQMHHTVDVGGRLWRFSPRGEAEDRRRESSKDGNNEWKCMCAFCCIKMTAKVMHTLVIRDESASLMTPLASSTSSFSIMARMDATKLMLVFSLKSLSLFVRDRRGNVCHVFRRSLWTESRLSTIWIILFST